METKKKVVKKAPTKKPTPKKANKPVANKLPSSVFIIQDVFMDYEGVSLNTIGFCYSEKEAEDIRNSRELSQKEKLSRFALLEKRVREELDRETISNLDKEIMEIDDIEDYKGTEVSEIKLLKK